MARILVIDDELMVRTLVMEVGQSLGHEVCLAETLEQGWHLAQDGADVVLLDVLLPDGNGLLRVRDFAALPCRPEILVITGHGNGDAAEAALHSGAWEYLVKPLRVRELKQSLSHMLAYRAERPIQEKAPQLDRGQIVGTSRALTKTLLALAEAASSNVNVLLLGETGVGKELFAKALYRNSARAGQPFVTVDCASLSETLVESHLFGHSRGAFTGADRPREGLLLAAHKGTLFLDEVGDLPLAMQGTFLRALELRRFRPIGEVNEVSSDFRLVAATNRDLEERVRLEQFRNDLLYRLQGITIRIPPLRERPEDIPELARHAVLVFCVQRDIPVKTLTEGCLGTLLEYSWPGNVRELIHAMEQACVTAGTEDSLYVRHLPTEVRVAVARSRVSGAACTPKPAMESKEDGTAVPTLRDWKLQTEAQYVRRLMLHSQGDVRLAASLAGLSRGHLYELLKKHALGGAR